MTHLRSQLRSSYKHLEQAHDSLMRLGYAPGVFAIVDQVREAIDSVASLIADEANPQNIRDVIAQFESQSDQYIYPNRLVLAAIEHVLKTQPADEIAYWIVRAINRLEQCDALNDPALPPHTAHR